MRNFNLLILLLLIGTCYSQNLDFPFGSAVNIDGVIHNDEWETHFKKS